jgi:uncharacterized protein YkwD
MSSFLKQLAVLALILLAVFYFKNGGPTTKDEILSIFHSGAAAQENALVSDVKKVVALAPPLRVPGTPVESGTLDDAGIIAITNTNRSKAGAGPLTYNAKLAASAKEKADDMFKNQYFEHVSPSGRGPADLANDVSYSYILIGENLAEGNFKDDLDLMNAWMASPGHRANILNTHFTEIGVAVVKGTFQGQSTWMAVQEFGEPLSACPAIDTSLKQSIDALKTIISNLDADLKVKKTDIDATSQNDPSYNSKVQAYDAEIVQYNTDLKQIQSSIATYNSEVQAFNACAQQP